jgi:hypothetical protein
MDAISSARIRPNNPATAFSAVARQANVTSGKDWEVGGFTCVSV